MTTPTAKRPKKVNRYSVSSTASVKRGGTRKKYLRHARRDRYGHGQDIVGQQGGAGDLGRQLAQVVAGDDVGAAPARVGVNGLLIRNRDDSQQDDNGDGDGKRQRKGRRAGQSQHDQNLLGGVSCGGERVRRKHRQTDPLGDRLVRRVSRL
jgi:hypothetical protein